MIGLNNITLFYSANNQIHKIKGHDKLKGYFKSEDDEILFKFGFFVNQQIKKDTTNLKLENFIQKSFNQKPLTMFFKPFLQFKRYENKEFDKYVKEILSPILETGLTLDDIDEEAFAFLIFTRKKPIFQKIVLDPIQIIKFEKD